MTLPTYPRPDGEHPSELRLDQYALDELAASDRVALELHLSRCDWCARRNALRDEGMAGFPDVDRDRMLRRLIEHSDAHAGLTRATPSTPWLRRAAPYVAAGAVIACAAAILLVVVPGSESTVGPPELTRKGDVALRVFRRAGGHAEEMLSRDAFSPGDRIRFALGPDDDAAWADRHILIAGVEAASGAVTVYYPSDSAGASARPAVSDDGALAGAVELDDYVGTEWLVLVACPQPFSLSDLSVPRSVLPRTAPQVDVPADCSRSEFAMTKR